MDYAATHSSRWVALTMDKELRRWIHEAPPDPVYTKMIEALQRGLKVTGHCPDHEPDGIFKPCCESALRERLGRLA